MTRTDHSAAGLSLFFFFFCSQKETMRLIVSNDRLKSNNQARDAFCSTVSWIYFQKCISCQMVLCHLYLFLKNLENKINMVLNREKSSQAIQR